MNLTKECLTPCIICKKIWKRGDSDKWIYHESKGVVCLHHHGIKEWYEKLLKGE